MAILHDATSHDQRSACARSRLFDFLLENYDVRSLILDNLSVYEFAMLAATNKSLRTVLFGDRFDVNRSLRRYVDDPIAFRGMLHKCGAFVGGTFPLSIFQGRRCEGGTLDLYVPTDKVEIVKAHLTIEELYHSETNWGTRGAEVVFIYPS